jgi:hypothetical protein
VSLLIRQAFGAGILSHPESKRQPSLVVNRRCRRALCAAVNISILMASPLLPYVTFRLLGVPKHKTKCDIAALFEPDDSKNILRISFGEAVLPSATPSRVVTVTFASNSQVLDNFLKAGHIIGDDIPNQPPTFGGRICLDIDFFGLTPLNTPVNVDKSAE